MRIITDTNIWYYIADGTIEFHAIKHLPLTATVVNLIELLSSPGLSNPHTYKNVLAACRAIKRFNPQFNLMAPYDFAAREYLGKKFKKKFHLNSFYEICDFGVTEEKIKYYTTLRSERVKDFKDSLTAQIIANRSRPDVLSQLKIANDAADMAVRDFLNELKNILLININNVNKNRIFRNGKGLDLYVRSRAHYNQKLILESNYLPAGNDQLDLANLLYVRNEDLYWTSDPKWINIINTVNMGHKLFKKYPF